MNKLLCIGALVAALGCSKPVESRPPGSMHFEFDRDAKAHFVDGVRRMKQVGVTYSKPLVYQILHDADENDDLYINAAEGKNLADVVFDPASTLGKLARSPHALDPDEFIKIQKEVGEKWTSTIYNLQYVNQQPVIMLTARETRQEDYQARR